MLISIFTIQIENDDNVQEGGGQDEELKSTLQSLLTQITEDDGSLTFDELSQLHATIKSLTEDTTEEDEDENTNNVNLSEDDGDSDEDENSNDKRRKQRRKRAESKVRNF